VGDAGQIKFNPIRASAIVILTAYQLPLVKW